MTEGNTVLSLTYLCDTKDVPLNGMIQVCLPGREDELTVYHLDDGFYAADDMCTHGMVSLAGGDIEDGEVICPLHGGAFDIRTGEATEPPCRVKLAVYDVVVEDDKVYAKLG